MAESAYKRAGTPDVPIRPLDTIVDPTDFAILDPMNPGTVSVSCNPPITSVTIEVADKDGTILTSEGGATTPSFGSATLNVPSLPAGRQFPSFPQSPQSGQFVRLRVRFYEGSALTTLETLKVYTQA
jgi:hypothetical protein